MGLLDNLHRGVGYAAMTVDQPEDVQTPVTSLRVGLKFDLFQLSLSHVKLDQLGRVSRFILTTLIQDDVSWPLLEQVIGLDRAALKPIEDRLKGLGYMSEEGLLTESGRAMAEIVTLMDRPQMVWVDACHSDRSFKKRLLILDQENSLNESEVPDSLPILGEMRNKTGQVFSQRKSQLKNIQSTINSWRDQGIFTSVLKRIWPDGAHLFEQADVVHDLDIICTAFSASPYQPASKIVDYELSLDFSLDEKGWRFYQPVLTCQRQLTWNSSAPKRVCKEESRDDWRSICLLSAGTVDVETTLKETPGEYGVLLEDYIEINRAGALEQLSEYFSSLDTPVFADIRYYFSESYAELRYGYERFYLEAHDGLQALPLHMDREHKKGKP
jgi:hypothetical protein